MPRHDDGRSLGKTAENRIRIRIGAVSGCGDLKQPVGPVLRTDTLSALLSHRGIKAGSADAVVENVHDAAGVQVNRTTEAILDHCGRVDSQRVVDLSLIHI